MLKGMLRFRRYRVFLIFAAIITLLIVRITHSRDWVQTPPTPALDFNSSPKNNAGSAPEKYPVPNTSNEKSKETVEPQSPDRISTSAKDAAPLSTTTTKSAVAAVETVPTVILPDRKPVVPDIVYSNEDEVVDELHPVAPPGRQEPIVLASPVPTTIHWEKQIQHFPVPTESIIRLPTGSPLKIAKIQHNFNDETSDAKITREKRQSKVKEEFLRSWTGYKKNAWLHDELSPVSGKFRDPFCGWAATLVDTLDTLWIMGLEAEFEEAAKAVDLIDFTTSPRQDIPMFETTIRYLGGLLAAYDVSGGRYKNLLDKAVELAEVLIGAFDTPNRMPVLYYRWKPTFASQPHRASQRSNLAELGSLSMEFTRLAQLTKDPKYYDAIARVTNALFEWQERGTKLDGLFPENVDTSGCNRTVAQINQDPISTGQEPAIIPVKSTEEPVGFVPVSPDPVKEPKPKKKKQKGGSGPSDLEFQILPGEPTKGEIIGWGGDGKKQMKRDSVGWGAEAKKPMKRDRTDNVTDSSTNHLIVSETAAATPTPTPTIDPITGLPLDIPAAKQAIGAGVGDWDCVAQGLVSATGYGLGDKFSMGGGRDSTYEYFLKVRKLFVN
jgi:mannosyl-oligosaccharide alpha-1,2-mannosidase